MGFSGFCGVAWSGLVCLVKIKNVRKHLVFLKKSIAKKGRHASDAAPDVFHWDQLLDAQRLLIQSVMNKSPKAQLAEHCEALQSVSGRADRMLQSALGDAKISAREFQVLFLVMQERTSKEIANELHLSHSYVNNVRSSLRARLDLPTEMELSDFIGEHAVATLPTTGPNREGILVKYHEGLEALASFLKARPGAVLSAEDYEQVENILLQIRPWMPDQVQFDVEFDHPQLMRNRFTVKEWQVMQFIVRGYSSRSIRQALKCSRSNVYRIRGSLRAKLGLSSGDSLTGFLIKHVRH